MLHSNWVQKFKDILLTKDSNRNQTPEQQKWRELDRKDKNESELEQMVLADLTDKGVYLEDTDKGKIVLLVNLTMNQKYIS